MFFLYNIFIFLYIFGIKVAALGNNKAKLWIRGRKGIFRKIEKDLPPGIRKTAWFHCASLGEFEQGRPVIEAFRSKNPDFTVILTFFSPSGYEIRKNYSGADHVFYLPADTPRNAERFINAVSPDVAYFIKYEYWYNYLSILKCRQIPVYMVSAIFRNSQPFFRRYGGWFRKQLKNITWFFVQDEDSLGLLKSIHFINVSVSGDTRFDRVAAIAGQRQQPAGVDSFCAGSTVLVAGSTWPEDEKILLPYIRENGEAMKFIIAPHEVHPSRINMIIGQLAGMRCIRLSEEKDNDLNTAQILVIDSIGILSSLYRFAWCAYIGGGFGAGIHNILEPAAYGAPVIFGPAFSKFREARDLISAGGAFSVKGSDDLRRILNDLRNNPAIHSRASVVCSSYVKSHKGATERIINSELIIRN